MTQDDIFMLAVPAILGPFVLSLAWTAFKIVAILSMAKRIATRIAMIATIGSTGVFGWLAYDRIGSTEIQPVVSIPKTTEAPRK